MKNILYVLGVTMCSALLISGCDEDNQPQTTIPTSTIPTNQATCGNHICEQGETPATCSSDCLVSSSICNDGLCASDELFTCPEDCHCGNGSCESNYGENSTNCKEDCVFCGDGICDPSEKKTCSKDCVQKTKSFCGDGTCDDSENYLFCPEDCHECGNLICEVEYGEEETCEDCIEDTDEYNDDPVCGDGVCDEGESCDEDCKTEEPLQKITLKQYNDLSDGDHTVFLFDYNKAMSPTSSSVEDNLNDFFAFPFPSDVRTDEKGHPSLKGYKLPIDFSSNILTRELFGNIIDSLVEAVQVERAGFSPLGAIYLRSSKPIASSDLAKMEKAKSVSNDSCIQLINVEPESSQYGKRLPVYLTFYKSSSRIVADNTLVVRPVPGIQPRPGERHALVVLSCLRAYGARIAQSERLKHILNKTAPDEINDKTSFYVDQLENVGIDLKEVRALTGYTTMNPANEMDQMAEALKGKGSILTQGDGTADGNWIKRGSYWAFHGKFNSPNFIKGNYSSDIPDYTKKGDGVIEFDKDGKLVTQPQMEAIEYEVIVPNTDMPEKGYPIIVYGHGTGGDSTTHSVGSNDEGVVLLNNNVPAAMLGFDACLQGNRTKGDGDETSLYAMMLQNPIVIRESVRQTVNDMLVLYDIIGSGKLVLPPNPNAFNAAMRDKKVIFDPSYGLYMGHSQGSQEAGLLLGLTGDIKSAFLSAGGGGVGLAFTELVFDQVKMTIADMLSIAFGLSKGSISYDTFITNHIVQPLLDPIDPLNFAHRFIKEPPSGWSPKNIGQTIGVGDKSTPNVTQVALSAAIGLPIVGEVYLNKGNMKDILSLSKLDTPVSSPVSNNVSSLDGTKASGGVMHFDYKGTANPHFVIYYMDSAKMSYVNFFKSVLDGKPTVSVSGSQSGKN